MIEHVNLQSNLIASGEKLNVCWESNFITLIIKQVEPKNTGKLWKVNFITFKSTYVAAYERQLVHITFLAPRQSPQNFWYNPVVEQAYWIFH